MAAAKPSLNLIERAIAAASPKWGFRRLMQKNALALAGGYAGASRSRATLRDWSPPNASADDDVAGDLPTLRGRSRDLVRNSPIAGAAVGTTVTHTVGTGLSFQAAIDADYLGLGEEEAAAWQANAEREFRLWCESTDCDITRHSNFYGLQSLAFRSPLESGDVFAVLASVARRNSPYSLAIQLIEADRVSNPDNKRNTDTLVDGVELDANGAAIRYHFASRYPTAWGRFASGTTWKPIDARGGNTDRLNVIHLFDRLRPGQTRGVPMLAPVMEPLKQLARYTDAELASAVNASIWSVFIKMDPAAFDDLFSNDKYFEDGAGTNYLRGAAGWDGTMSPSIENPAKAVNLLPGESIESPAPGRPSDKFDPFVDAIVSQIGARLEIPHEVLIKHFQSSYSAARAALLDAWRFFRGRRDWLATYFCQPIYELWLEEAIGLGRVSAPGFFADPAIRKAYCGAVWVGDGPGSIDPLKEVQAAKMRVEEEFSTRAAESILHDGVGWEHKHRQRAKEERLRRADDTVAATTAPAKPAPDTPNAEPNPAQP